MLVSLSGIGHRCSQEDLPDRRSVSPCTGFQEGQKIAMKSRTVGTARVRTHPSLWTEPRNEKRETRLAFWAVVRCRFTVISERTQAASVVILRIEIRSFDLLKCSGNKKFRRKWCDACTWRDMNFFTPPVLENGVRFLALWAPTSGAAACVQCRLDR